MEQGHSHREYEQEHCTTSTSTSSCSALREDLLTLDHLCYLQLATQLRMGYRLLVWIVKLGIASTVILPLQKVEERSIYKQTPFFHALKSRVKSEFCSEGPNLWLVTSVHPPLFWKIHDLSFAK